jgi:hypothetical protein
MELVSLSKIILSLSLILVVLYIILKITQKYGKLGNRGINSKNSPKIVSTLFVDDGTKIVTLNYKSNQYILTCGKSGTTLIDKITIEQEVNHEFKKEPLA